MFKVQQRTLSYILEHTELSWNTFFFFRTDGSFVVHDVPSGSYVVEVISPAHKFEPVRVDITSKGKMRWVFLICLCIDELRVFDSTVSELMEQCCRFCVPSQTVCVSFFWHHFLKHVSQIPAFDIFLPFIIREKGL